MIKLACNKCGTDHEFEDSSLVCEIVGSDDRLMGTENEYSGIIVVNCEKCQNHLIAEFNFWEYPIMTLNYSEYNEEGCVVTKEPDYQSYLTISELDNYEE